MKFKCAVLSAVYLILCIVDWLFSNLPIIKAIETGYFTEMDILMSLHDSANGYNGLQEILVVYTLPILFGIYYLSDKETAYCILRYRTRSIYILKEIGKVLLVAGGFSVIHELVNYIFVNVVFGTELLKEHNFLEFSILTAVILCLFCLQTGILYHIIGDVISNKIFAILGSFAFNFFQFLLIKYYIRNFWIPGMDLLCTFEYLIGNSNMLPVFAAIGRNILIVFIIYMLCQMRFEKKDIMNYEE